MQMRHALGTLLTVTLALTTLGGCSRKKALTLTVVEYGTKKPICDGVEFRAEVAHGGGMRSPNKATAPVITSKAVGCAFELEGLPPVAKDDSLGILISKAGYADGTKALSGAALANPAFVANLSPVELVASAH